MHPIRDMLSIDDPKDISTSVRTRLGLLLVQFWPFPEVGSTWVTSVYLFRRLRASAFTHVLMEKLLTPMALTLPVSSNSSIFAQVSLKATSARGIPSSTQFTGQRFSPTSGKRGSLNQKQEVWNALAHHNRPKKRGCA